MATVSKKSIGSILYIAGVQSRGSFVAREVITALKQFDKGDVVPVISTLIDLTNGKFKTTLNKAGVVGMHSAITKQCMLAKSQFKRFGFAMTLSIIVADESEELNEALCLALDSLDNKDDIKKTAVSDFSSIFLSHAKSCADDLKTAYEATKPAKVAKNTIVASDTTEAATVDTTEAATVGTTDQDTMSLPVDIVLAATVRAIQAGLLDASQLVELRMCLAELPSITAQDIAAIH